MDVKQIKFAELVDVAELNKLMQSFHAVIGIANAVIDTTGVVITSSGWQEACVNFHRVHPETCKRCIESDTSLVESLTKGSPYAIYNCLNGLVDTAAPIVVDGVHVANVFTGQFFTDPPDLEFFRMRAQEFGFDEEAYLAAIRKVPVVEKNRVEAITQFYANIARMLANNGLDRLKQRESAQELQQLNLELQQRVTERTQEVTEKNRLLLAVLDAIPSLVFWKDADLRYLGCNRQFAKVAGLNSPDEVIGLTDHDMPWAGMADGYETDDRSVIMSCSPRLHYEESWVDEDGNTMYASISKMPLCDADGKVLGMLGSYEDITSSKQAEAAMAKYKWVIDASMDGFWLFDMQGNIQEVNQAYADISGYSKQELVGMHISQLESKELSADEVKAHIQKIVGQGSDRFETRHRRKDGSEVDIEVSTNYLQQSRQLVAFCRDITRRKQAEVSRLASEQRFHAFFDHSVVGLAITSLEKGWVEVNEALCNTLGYTREEFTALTWVELTYPDDLAPDLVQFNRMMAGEISSYLMDKRFLHKDGHLVYTRLAVSNVRKPDGQVDYVVAMVEDITERTLAEQALKQSNADLEQFAYSVSHDMRQPLRMVTGHLQLLARALGDQLQDDDKDNLNFALDGARRMDAMIVSLLEYSRVGRLTRPKEPLASREVLDEAINFLTPAIEEAQAKVVISGEWPQVVASRDELSRLFQNLIGNALHYRQPDQPPHIELHSTADGGHWQVRVQDHGIGIDPTQIDRLFKFFSRLQSRARFEGTGMGLALCRRIVEHHQGRIWAESAGEGQGAAFVFDMPLTVAAPAEEPD